MQSKYVRYFCVLVTALALVSFASQTPAAQKQPSKDAVAVVNGSVISRAEFDAEIGRVQQRFSSMGQPLSSTRLSEIKNEILENFIGRELLYRASQENGIKADEAAVNEQLTELKKRFPSEVEFKKALGEMNLSEAMMKSQLERNVAIKEFIEKQFVQKITISDKESKAHYKSNPDLFKQPEQVQASHILIKIDPQADESQKAEARKKIEQIQKRLQKGEDFAALAKEFSQCPSNAKGGDLGYFGRGQMVPPFEKTAFALKPGTVSDIVETQFGYHLIKVTDKKVATTIPYKDVKEKLDQHLKQEKIQKEVTLYVEKLKEKAKVERFPTDNP
ncbi:MAG: peptidylprolyl isomerase [Deltaproteobacteria bacterium]|nr:peptidylprolyl isomerase [Deltaproteobacteria bacterium]